jgi:hypothetical protein
MQISNVDRVLVFRLSQGHVFTQAEIEENYPIVPDGSMNYFGVEDANLANLKNGTAMSHDLHAFMQDILDTLKVAEADEKIVILGVEPSAPGNPYEYVSTNIKLMRQLAADVKGYQSQAMAAGKKLTVVMRYASEMNGNGEVYSGLKYQDAFKNSFVEVRNAVKAVAPDVLFSFSPMINSDIHEDAIHGYWPGDDNVDIIGGTWYVHGDDPKPQQSTDNMIAYYAHRAGLGIPLAIDEFGGALGSGDVYHDNDAVLPKMLDAIAGLKEQHQVSFRYGLIFLDDHKYGVDATLNFLSPAEAKPPLLPAPGAR